MFARDALDGIPDRGRRHTAPTGRRPAAGSVRGPRCKFVPGTQVAIAGSMSFTQLPGRLASGAVDAVEPAAVIAFPGPYPGRGVRGGVFTHASVSLASWIRKARSSRRDQRRAIHAFPHGGGAPAPIGVVHSAPGDRAHGLAFPAPCPDVTRGPAANRARRMGGPLPDPRDRSDFTSRRTVLYGPIPGPGGVPGLDVRRSCRRGHRSNTCPDRPRTAPASRR